MVGMRRWVIGMAIAAAGLAGCGTSADTGTTPILSTGSSAPPAASASSTLPLPSLTSTLLPPPPSSPIGTTAPPTASGGTTSMFASPPSRKPGARLTLTGTVEAGVEASCLVLEDEKTGLRVNLTGGEKAVVRVGSRITVVGQLRNDVMSYCQQGPVFVVIEATAG